LLNHDVIRNNVVNVTGHNFVQGYSLSGLFEIILIDIFVRVNIVAADALMTNGVLIIIMKCDDHGETMSIHVNMM